MAAALVLSIPAAGPLHAQAPAPSGPAARVGLVGGLNLATLGGDDAEGAENKTGVLAGGYLSLGLSDVFSIQPELLYSMKGSKTEEDGGRLQLDLNYVEVPLLFKVSVPSAGGIRPHFYAGPAFAYRTGCRIKLSGGGFSFGASCDSFFGDLGEELGEELGEDFEPDDELSFDVKKFDASAVVGGGITFPVGRQNLGIGVRYTYGLVDLVEGANSRNRTLSFLLSLDFPIGR